MNKIIFTFLVFFTTQSLAQKLEYSLTFAKDTFLVCENIDCFLTLKNITSNEVLGDVKKVKFNLRNQNNESIPAGYYGVNGEFEYKITVTLDGELYRKINVLQNFGKFYNHSWIILYIPEGKYLFEIVLIDDSNNEITVVDSFWVNEPIADEAYVLNTFAEIMGRTRTPEELNSLYQYFPNSVYTCQILLVLESLYLLDPKLNDPNKAKEVQRILVENYSTSLFSTNIKHFLLSMENESERIELLNKIKTKAKGTIYEKFYDQELKEIEEN